MARLLEKIKLAVRENRYRVSIHADERLEERLITPWQVISGLDEARLIEERPRSMPNPSVIVKQSLADGSDVEAVWSWHAGTRLARLVTVYFRE